MIRTSSGSNASTRAWLSNMFIRYLSNSLPQCAVGGISRYGGLRGHSIPVAATNLVAVKDRSNTWRVAAAPATISEKNCALSDQPGAPDM